MALVAFALAAAVAGHEDQPRIHTLGAHAAVLAGSACNVIVLDEPGRVLLVDDQAQANDAETARLLRSRYDRRVAYVVNAHRHLDHAGGNRPLSQRGHLARAASILLHWRNGTPELTRRDQRQCWSGKGDQDMDISPRLVVLLATAMLSVAKRPSSQPKTIADTSSPVLPGTSRWRRLARRA